MRVRGGNVSERESVKGRERGTGKVRGGGTVREREGGSRRVRVREEVEEGERE